MVDKPETGEKKTLEMRVAELEDKLAKVHITEEEMKAYHKVSALLGGAAAAAVAPAGPVAAGCVVDCVSGCINECRQCVIRQCTVARFCTILRQCTVIRQCTVECFECGGGLGSGGGGGFGTLGG